MNPKLPISILTAGTSQALPTLPAFKAASTWATLLMVLAAACNAMGVDLFAALRDMGLGDSPQDVIVTGDRAISAVQQLLPMVFGLWAWIERKAPRFRLTLFNRS